MSKEKLSSQEIIDIVASKASVSKRASEEFLKVMISTIEEALLAGDSVKIKNFGTFKLQWNEPRKSVNVKTGEDIILAGYYKVNFTPEANLRDLVNEPFAHLEAVQLDGSPVEPVQKETESIDPLRTLNEQASEIKDILAEIMNIQSGSGNDETDNDNVELNIPKEFEITEDEIPHQEHIEEAQISINETIEEKTVIKKNENQDVKITKPVVESEAVVEIEMPASVSKESVSDTKSEETIETPLVLSDKKKSKVWLWVVIILILFSASGTGLYFYYPPAKRTMSAFGKSIKITTTEAFVNFSDWLNSKPKKQDIPVTIVIPKDTSAVDSVEEDEILPVDSLQLLFDNPRNYSEIIATETIKSGSRLTTMANKYYGLKDFWVYIYEANREKIIDPDKIPTGTIIYIPKLDSRLIDKSNQRCINKARELHDLYVKRP